MNDATPAADVPLTHLLRRLGSSPEVAGDGYEALRRLLCRYFEVRACHDAGALSDEVLDRLARRLAGGVDVGDVGAYARGIARLVLLEARRRPVEEALDTERAAAVADDESEREATATCLERCLARLDAETQGQVLDYYAADGRGRIDGRKRLATRLGVSATALRLRMLRMRLTLERCVSACRADGAKHMAPGSTDR